MRTEYHVFFSILSLFLIISLLAQTPLSGQSFIDIGASLAGVSNSSAAWGDYDNDRDLDILISGETTSGISVVKLYSNESGIFEEVNSDFTGIKNGSVDWGDYDNDGDLDLLVTGNSEYQQAFLYRNDNTNFVPVNAGFSYFGAYSHASWGDFDNDGDLDAFITGSWNTKLYENVGQDTFTDNGFDFISLSSSRSCWGDYDKDGDNDILVAGDTGGGMKLFCYKNNDGQFEEIEFANMGLSAGSVEWGDYDNDGDPDILIMGFNDNVEPDAHIYRNDGNHVFVNIWAGLPPVAMGNASWGDADNDGDLDIAITGKLAGCGATASAIYENQGNGIFNDITAFLTNAERSAVSWGDFDGDTDLDLLLAGVEYNGNSSTKIYRNDFSLPNILPASPQNLTFAVEGNDVILSWDKATDAQTSQNSLTYNIRLGTGPQSEDLLSPMSFSFDGLRKLNKFGNTGFNNYFIFKNLEPGTTYYWSVQTLDNTFAGSEFSEEQSFYYTYTSYDDKLSLHKEFIISPNPASHSVQFFSPESNLNEFNVIISSIEGKKIWEQTISIEEQLDVSFLEKGIYLVNITVSDQNFTERLIIR
jgi:hypothetical protein